MPLIIEQLGLEADLRRTFVSLLELGEQHPSLITLFKIAPALGVTPSEVVRRTELLVR
ncbi:helix-turn-helix domain-containing protein [Alcaligenaceae bacterium LF4-65]|uniref:Helix-turn-helix domain-containing protein n=1 Tax=Zwartia hollandica TaxID=324606 RepID=A0A953T4J8_9BURK|nr:helix-turn-helix domain-containing protein [Zwartia hollandica]